MTSFWGVVRSKPRQERRADYNLQAQGYETLLPYQNTTNRRSGKLFESRVPLFPGYLFVKMGDYCSRSILSTYGVSQLLTGEGGKAKKIEQNIIDEILRNCDETGLYTHSDLLSVGDEVRLTRGPFVSAIAKVQSLQSKDRIFVFLDLMGQSVKVSVSRSDALKV